MPEPKELEQRTIKGKPCIFVGGKWCELKERKEARDTSKDIECSIKIGETTLKAIAIPQKFKKSGRTGYTVIVNRGQRLFGNANLFVA